MGRAPCCDKSSVKKGPWSPEEDAKLKEFINKFGTGGNWISLPQKAGLKRCGKSCRLRWLNYLRPNIKHGEFSDEEDATICTLYATIGSRWSIIAAQLPGRTDNDIKNYWNTKLKKKLMGLNYNYSKNLQPFSSLSHMYSADDHNNYNHLSKISFPTPVDQSIFTSAPQNSNFMYPNGQCSSSYSLQQNHLEGNMVNFQYQPGKIPINNNMLIFGSENNEMSYASSSDGISKELDPMVSNLLLENYQKGLFGDALNATYGDQEIGAKNGVLPNRGLEGDQVGENKSDEKGVYYYYYY
ncbi:hypothetical protein CASFOL_026765 [Castilleja foliolosa]|uniref:Uncharacterized protein n=1 Tax=Castilleja foliolosa TaxID=1961234 RepID=A0ABD3CHZ4_9LAMI